MHAGHCQWNWRAREPASLSLHQVAHELEIVAPFNRSAEDLRFEQLVETEQGGIPPQLVADEAIGRLRSLPVQGRLKGDIQQIERGVLGEVAAEQGEPGRAVADRLVALEEPMRDQREERRILALDALPMVDRFLVPPGGGGEVAGEDARAHA